MHHTSYHSDITLYTHKTPPSFTLFSFSSVHQRDDCITCTTVTMALNNPITVIVRLIGHMHAALRGKIIKKNSKRKKEQGVGGRKNEQNYEKERNEPSEAGRREGESRAHLEACRERELGAQGWKQRFRNTAINLMSDSQHKGHNNSY